MSLSGRLAAFAVVAGRASRHQVIPGVRSTLVARHDVVTGQLGGFGAAVLSGVVITTEDLCLGQLDGGARPFDHVFQADDGRGGVKFGNCFDMAAAVFNQPGFLGEDQRQGAFCRANIERLKVRVQYQYGRGEDRSSRTHFDFKG